MKKMIFLLIAMFVAFSVYAGTSTTRDRVDNWLKSGPSNSCIAPDEDPSNAPTVGDTPVGEGLLILTLLASGYAFVNKKRESKKSGV